MPWTAEAEAAEASRCARYSLGDIEHVVHETGIAWEWLVEVSMRRVRASVPVSYCAAWTPQLQLLGCDSLACAHCWRPTHEVGP